MIRTFLFVGILAASVLSAQDFGRGRGDAGGFARFSPLLAAVDADQSGAISAFELRNAGAALGRLDANGDGVLSQDELRPGAAPQGGSGGVSSELLSTLMAFDEDGDGELTTSEVPERMQGIFERGDTNSDGVLTREELSGLTASQSASQGDSGRFGGRGGRGGRDRGRGGFGMDPAFSALDADQSGSLSAEELKGAGEALLRLDANGDGSLTEDEVRPSFGPPRRRGDSVDGRPDSVAGFVTPPPSWGDAPEAC